MCIFINPPGRSTCQPNSWPNLFADSESRLRLCVNCAPCAIEYVLSQDCTTGRCAMYH
jgi:hypothetical protein